MVSVCGCLVLKQDGITWLGSGSGKIVYLKFPERRERRKQGGESGEGEKKRRRIEWEVEIERRKTERGREREWGGGA